MWQALLRIFFTGCIDNDLLSHQGHTRSVMVDGGVIKAGLNVVGQERVLVGMRELAHGHHPADRDAHIAPLLLTQVGVAQFVDGMPGVNVRTIERYRVFEYVCTYIAE